MFEQTLYGLNKNGSFKVWSIKARDIDGIGVLNICHGAYGGKITDKQENLTEGKQGRSAYEQAVFEAQSRIKKQLDKNYRPTMEELEDLPILAMLSKDFAKDSKPEDVKEGFASDKFDGVRGLSKCHKVTAEISLESRTGQPYDVPHIVEQLKKVMKPGDIFDGELYLHGPALQEINSAVTRTDTQGKIDEAQRKLDKQLKKDPSDWEKINKAAAELEEARYIHDIRPQLEFHVFDIVDLDRPFEQRILNLLEIGKRFAEVPNIIEVQYTSVRNYDDLMRAHKAAVDAGYEGVMYRTRDGMYESGKRSRGLWKFKVFFDKEFRINRTEKDKQGYIVFVLQNDLKDNEFNCVMGDYGWRLAYADVDFSSQWMTVQFQSRYKKTLKPQFPTGKLIRKGAVVNGEFVPSE
jgi:DNA ligase-1